MKIQQRDSKDEKTILTAMIIDPYVLGRIAAKWDRNNPLFESKWSNIVAQWCVDYFQRYDKPPKKNIAQLYESWSSENQDEDVSELMNKFLSSLSREYEAAKEINSQFVMDLAGEYFNRISLSKLGQALQGDIQRGKVAEALKRVENFNKLEIVTNDHIDVFNGEAAIREAFESKAEPIIAYPGALGEFYGDALERDGFVAILAPEKRGKTWSLLDLAYTAVLQQRKVAFFEVGDMSQNQILRRFATRVCRRPMKPKTVKIPISITREPHAPEADIIYEEKEYTDELTWQAAWKRVQRVKTKLGIGEDLLKLSIHANSSINVAGIRSILQSWQRRSNWSPDVIVVDYADILAPPSGIAESRDQINQTWKQLRQLSQTYHCLVITATQADAASYKQDLLDRTNFSEDKRKFAHVTAMLGLNQTDMEKKQGLWRYNWIVLRENEFSLSECCYVAGCLSIGHPTMISTF